MRSFLGFVLFTGALIAAIAAFVVPPLVAPLVVATVRQASPFGGPPLEVEVDVDAVGLIRGVVSEIRIAGADLVMDGVSIANLEVTVRDVEIGGDHAFADVTGGLDTIVVPRSNRWSINVRSIALAGPSTHVTATATLGPTSAILLIEQSLAEAGVPATDPELVDGGVAFTVAGQRVQVALLVVDGAIVVPVLGPSPVPVLEPEPGDPWRITGVTVDPTGLAIEASIDAAGLPAPD